MNVRLIEANRQRFAGSAEQVTAPTTAGELSVLEFHAPMLCALAAGTVQVDAERFPVRGGLVRVYRNTVLIMAE